MVVSLYSLIMLESVSLSLQPRKEQFVECFVCRLYHDSSRY